MCRISDAWIILVGAPEVGEVLEVYARWDCVVIEMHDAAFWLILGFGSGGFNFGAGENDAAVTEPEDGPAVAVRRSGRGDGCGEIAKKDIRRHNRGSVRRGVRRISIDMGACGKRLKQRLG